jgi:hypothetical protein
LTWALLERDSEFCRKKAQNSQKGLLMGDPHGGGEALILAILKLNRKAAKAQRYKKIGIGRLFNFASNWSIIFQ